jgi:DNA-binding NarL/FixJ family response regulator
MVVRLIIVVEERIFADALATRLETEHDVEIVAAVHTTAPSPSVFSRSPADVMLLDGDLPDDAAFRLCEELSQRSDVPYVIFLSLSSESTRIVRAVSAGAVGWVRKDESVDRLIQVIRGTARGETWLPQGETGEVLRLLLRRPEPEEDGEMLAALTRREREVLVCLAEGTGRRDLAEHLHMSPNTVRTHLQNLMSKLGVHSALEAVALARPQLGDQLSQRRAVC